MYHDGMSASRQEGDLGAGRVNQKRRTRAAIVEAARELLDEGTPPTVSQAARRALVSRTTAYRYFPTQESLQLELSVNIDVDEIEELVNRPLGDESPTERTVTVMRQLNEHVVEEEVRYRASSRLYLDLWLSAVASGEDAPVVREGRRKRWITTTLGQGLDDVSAKDRDRLLAALTLLCGVEAITVLRDVAQLNAEDALDVADWAARTLIDATAATSRPSRSGPTKMAG